MILNYINILRLFNIISGCLLFTSSILIFLDNRSEVNITSLIIGIYNLIWLFPLSNLIFNQQNIEELLIIPNHYYYIVSIIYLNFGIILCALNNTTIGCGIIILICSIYNLLVGLFEKNDILIRTNYNTYNNSEHGNDTDSNNTVIDADNLSIREQSSFVNNI